jgi:ribose/xylose/arabinose/galactoside ABC-type transport system permease subunit
VILLSTDSPGDVVTSQVLWVPFSALAGLVAPIAVLVSWGEFDLSSMGVMGLAAYAYAEIANDDRTLLGAVAAIAMCAGLGGLVGTLRLLTHAHSVMISISLGLLALGVVLEVAPLSGMQVGGRISSLVVFVIAMAIVAGATGLAALAPSRADTHVTTPTPRVVAGFALAGLGTGFYAVAVTSRAGFTSPSQNLGGFIVLLAFAAVAVGGVGLGAGITAPLLAALGALVVTVVDISGLMYGWSGWRFIAIGAVFAGSVVVGGTIRRLMS